MPTHTPQDLNAFVQALQDPAFFARVGPGFALLTAGDWPALLRWGAACGYAFTLPELDAHCRANPHILAALTRHARLAGWSAASLQQAATAAAN